MRPERQNTFHLSLGTHTFLFPHYRRAKSQTISSRADAIRQVFEGKFQGFQLLLRKLGGLAISIYTIHLVIKPGIRLTKIGPRQIRPRNSDKQIPQLLLHCLSLLFLFHNDLVLQLSRHKYNTNFRTKLKNNELFLDKYEKSTYLCGGKYFQWGHHSKNDCIRSPFLWAETLLRHEEWYNVKFCRILTIKTSMYYEFKNHFHD